MRTSKSNIELELEANKSRISGDSGHMINKSDIVEDLDNYLQVYVPTNCERIYIDI